MRHLLTILAALLLCFAPLQAQTLKSLMFNSTNGQVVANTGTNVLTFINELSFGTNAASTTRANLGFSTNLNALWTATTASNARSAIGISATNNVEFASIDATNITSSGGLNALNLNVEAGGSVVFNDAAAAAYTRTNLFLGLPALTNTSNVTMMRALSGSANTNHPYSGTISVVGTNNTNTLVFSNGILQSAQ